MAGRPRKNVNALQGAYTKEALKERIEKEKSITGDCDNIPPPKFIENDKIAMEEYYRIVEELKKVGIVTNVDSVLLGIYADSYSKYYSATIAMENQDLVTEYTNKGKQTNQVVNPYIKIQMQYAQQIMKLSNLYGFDPSSRAKIAHLQPSNKEKEDNPLVALAKKMNGNK